MRWLVVSAANPDSSSDEARISMVPQPPGPGLPLHARLYISTCGFRSVILLHARNSLDTRLYWQTRIESVTIS